MLGLVLAVSVGVFLPGRTVVSDTNAYTCGSSPASELSPDGKRIFSSILVSRTGFGEAHDAVALVDIPLERPSDARTHLLVHVGETICGLAVRDVDSYDAFLFHGRMRCMIGLNGSRLAWRDWDPGTRKVCGEGLFRWRAASGTPAEDLVPEVLTRTLDARGFRGHDVAKGGDRDRMICHSHAQWTGGAFYGTLTTAASQPVVFRCADGETLEFVGVVPALCEYECMLAQVGGHFYALGRKVKGDNFFVSDDGAKTFRPVGRLPDGEQRPQLVPYRGKLLIGYSAPGETPNSVRDGRNNLHLLFGMGAELGNYEEIFHAVDPLGIVYCNLVPQGDILHILWSDARRYPEKKLHGAVQGRDRLLYGRL